MRTFLLSCFTTLHCVFLHVFLSAPRLQCDLLTSTVFFFCVFYYEFPLGFTSCIILPLNFSEDMFSGTCVPHFTVFSRPSNFVSTCLSLPMFFPGALRSIRLSPSILQLPYSFIFCYSKVIFLCIGSLSSPHTTTVSGKMSSGSLCSLHFILQRISASLISLPLSPSSAPKHALESSLLSSSVVMQPIPPPQCHPEFIFL